MQRRERKYSASDGTAGDASDGTAGDAANMSEK